MRILYYDCFSGISGDMNIGALLDLGVDQKYFVEELNKLGLEDEFDITVEKNNKKGISGTKFNVILKQQRHHQHEEDHHHHRNLRDIEDIINKSSLKDSVKKLSLEIFYQVAKAEAKVHGEDIYKIHFHEVGAIDSIVDIVGAAIGFDYLKIDKVICSPVEVGYGFVKCAHGILPVPAPATAEILKDIPILAKNVPFEATTPTGAAIIKTLCSNFTYGKNFKVNKVGYGLGTKEGEKVPNVLRVFLGEACVEHNEEEYVIECNIDDMSGEIYEILMDKLLANGALDVYFTPIIMKKSRPATKVTLICNEANCNELEEVLFKNTTTLGIRKIKIERKKLERHSKVLNTEYGEIRIKVGTYNGEEIKIKPEYEDCKNICETYGITYMNLYEKIILQYSKEKNS
ncbi:nickel pincer cofactor biosynthesis protein LarC [Desnuesiella massiliensis]|uniref:nickel pincer cofactor biosynthesis protein LarC n=1 Tax=Desnuesiella massiliensis TaxID=1650662 RepID=UPI0006E31D9A|nr:nickel pincer cofactor biosynthesis protein LarC [Desnuesiella massiliensis]